MTKHITKLYAALMSGYHGELAKTELSAVVRSLAGSIAGYVKSAVYFRLEQKKLGRLKNLALSHGIYEVILLAEGEKKFFKELGSINLAKSRKSFAIKVKSLDEKLSSKEIKKATDAVYLRTNKKVNLDNPDETFVVLMSEDGVFLARELFKIDKADLFMYGGSRKPYQKPITLDPRLARCMVNLAGLQHGRRPVSVLDPFCGTGAILLEAAHLGFSVHGSDLSEEMVSGTKLNLKHFGFGRFIKNIHIADVTRLKPSKRFDAIVTDPPYGIASSSFGRKLKELYVKSIASMAKLLKKKGKLVISIPSSYLNDVGNQAKKSRLARRALVHQPVHRNLKRSFLVFEKK